MIDEDINLDEPLGQETAVLEEPEPAVEPEPEPEPTPTVDIEAIRQEERARALAEFQAAAQASKPVQPDNEDAELEAIAELQYSDPVEAERRRISLAEKRMARRFESQHGQALAAAGISAAVADAQARLSDLPDHVAKYVPQVVRDLGIQGPINDQVLPAVKQLAYGAAAMKGETAQKAAPKTVRASGSEEPGGGPTVQIPNDLRPDAEAYAKAFGKDSLHRQLKEIHG
jgi:hypothetical protein